MHVFGPTGYVPARFTRPGDSIAKFLHDRSDVPSFDPEAFAYALEKLWSQYDDKLRIMRTPMSLEDAVFGTLDIPGLPSDTSPGFPWGNQFKKKADAFEDEETWRFLQDDFQRLGDDEFYRSGPWLVNLKDELRKTEKVYRPRAFAGGPLDLIVHGKRLFGQMDADIRDSCWRAPIRVGMTTFHGGMDLLKRIHATRKYHFDGDYSDYDGRRRIWAIVAVAFFRQRYVDPLYHTHLWNYYDCVACEPWVLPNGELRERNGTFPSGLWTCATDNSIWNALELYMAEFSCSRTRDWVISVYGDDHVVSTDQVDLDMLQVKNYLERLGESYTSATKDAVPTLSNIQSVQFLKCKFSNTEPCYPWRESPRVFAILEWAHRMDDETRTQRVNAALLSSCGTTAYEDIRLYAEMQHQRCPEFPILSDEQVREIVMPGVGEHTPIAVWRPSGRVDETRQF